MVAPVCAPVRNSMQGLLTNAFTYLSIGTWALGFLLRWKSAQYTTNLELGICWRAGCWQPQQLSCSMLKKIGSYRPARP